MKKEMFVQVLMKAIEQNSMQNYYKKNNYKDK